MTAEFFPGKAVTWKLEKPPPLKELSLSLPYMALLTGVMLRFWRSYSLTHGAPESWAWVGGTYLIGIVFLYLMVAIHLGNYRLRQWTWRAPAFAVLEAGTEVLMSLALTTLGLEPLGADRAELSDWLPTGVRTLIWRMLEIVLFVIVLAVVVSIIRRILLVAEHRAVRAQLASHGRGAAPDNLTHTTDASGGGT